MPYINVRYISNWGSNGLARLPDSLGWDDQIISNIVLKDLAISYYKPNTDMKFNQNMTW